MVADQIAAAYIRWFVTWNVDSWPVNPRQFRLVEGIATGVVVATALYTAPLLRISMRMPPALSREAITRIGPVAVVQSNGMAQVSIGVFADRPQRRTI